MTDNGSTGQAQQPPVMEATEARQGRRGKHVLWILVISLVLVALALWGAWAARAPDLAKVEPNGTAFGPESKSFNAPAPAAATKQQAPDQASGS